MSDQQGRCANPKCGHPEVNHRVLPTSTENGPDRYDYGYVRASCTVRNCPCPRFVPAEPDAEEGCARCSGGIKEHRWKDGKMVCKDGVEVQPPAEAQPEGAATCGDCALRNDPCIGRPSDQPFPRSGTAACSCFKAQPEGKCEHPEANLFRMPGGWTGPFAVDGADVECARDDCDAKFRLLPADVVGEAARRIHGELEREE